MKANVSVADPPAIYPFISEQIKEKKDLRKIYTHLQMNRYLDDSDSDLTEFSSVGSDKVKEYETKYTQILKGGNKEDHPPIRFELHNRCKTKSQIIQETKRKHGIKCDFEISPQKHESKKL